MKRLSFHRCRERQEAWRKAQGILMPAAMHCQMDSLVFESWCDCRAMAVLWREIESALWEMHYKPLRQFLTAAVTA